LIKLAAKAPPGAGNGAIISTVSPGTKVARIRFTNTVAFTASSTSDLVFLPSTATNPLYPTKVALYIAGINTQLPVTPGYNANILENPVLNPPATLAVTPANQDVTAASGNTSFAVTSTAGWTATSNQAWCTVSPSGFGNGTITAAYTQNITSTPRVAEITVTVTGLPATVVTVTQQGVQEKVLNLSLFLEGYYTGSGQMRTAMDESGAHWGVGIADKITVELHDMNNYSNIIYSANNVNLSTSGTSTVTLPSSYSGSYYLTIRNRNSIETVSMNPVSFAAGTINYDFDLPAKAYGNNLLLMIDGRWVIYGGDVNQDGLIDSGDMTGVDNDATAFISGYVDNDANGDGLIDSGDMTIIDNNATGFVSAIIP
jgi:hypothetical protein